MIAAGWAAFGVTTVLGQELPSPGRVGIEQPRRPIGEFELKDQDGQPFRFSSLRGRPVLLFFGFTACPDVCPAILARLKTLADSTDPQLRELAIVMVSVDGERDSAATIKAYLARLSPRFMGVTGDPKTVRTIAAQFRAVFFRGLPDGPGGPYLVEHSAQVYLVDSQGRLYATLYDAPIHDLERIAKALVSETGGR